MRKNSRFNPNALTDSQVTTHLTPRICAVHELRTDLQKDLRLSPFVVPDAITRPTPLKNNRRKKCTPCHIPRPANSFILFRSAFIRSQAISSNIEKHRGTLSVIIAMTWHSLPDEKRRYWQNLAKEVQLEHKKKYPDFDYKAEKGKDVSARSCRSQGSRRIKKARETDLERCKKIAELALSGMTGKVLEAAIEDFDRTRSREVQARFVDPLTAGQYMCSTYLHQLMKKMSTVESTFHSYALPNNCVWPPCTWSPIDGPSITTPHSHQALSTCPSLELNTPCETYGGYPYSGRSSPSSGVLIQSGLFPNESDTSMVSCSPFFQDRSLFFLLL